MATQYQLENTTEAYSKVKSRFSCQILDKLKVHLSDEAHIIEIGPGAGHFAQECIKRGYSYTAIETSAPLRTELENLGVAVIDATIPPASLGDDNVDLFYTSMVFEHMPDYSNAIGFVEEAIRILKPGGIMCLTFPDTHTCRKIFWEMDYTHSYFTTPRRVAQMCRQLVVEVKESIGWFWVHSTPLHDVLRH